MFETSKTIRIPVTGSPVCNFLECAVGYSKGGYNYFTYKTDPRGYYVSCTPVTVKDNMVSFEAFSGLKRLVKEVTRRSAKAEKEAVFSAELALGELVSKVCSRHGLDYATVSENFSCAVDC